MPVYKTMKYTLKKRGESWAFNVRVTEDGIQKRIRQSHSTEAGAIESVERIIDRSLAGTTAVAPTTHQFSSPTLRKVFDMVLDAEWKGTRGEVTAKKNAEDCLSELGEATPVDKVATEDVDRLIKTFKDREFSPATIRRKLAALGRLLHYAAERHWIKAMPLINRRRLGKEKERLRYITAEEESRGLEYLRFIGRPMNANFFAFLIDTGLRLSEAVNLKWKDVDGEEWVRVLQNKADHPRSIPTTDRVKGILRDRRTACPKGEQRVWHELTVDATQWSWGLLRENLGMVDDPDFVIHACRHTFASRLACAGCQLTVIKELGGWKTLSMVMRYAHLCPDAKAAAIRQMQDGQQRKIG